MTDHEHDRGERPPQDGEPMGSWWTAMHRDWRFWVALVFALMAMILYAMSLEEAIRPFGPGRR